MIGYIEGNVVAAEPHRIIVLTAQGLGYEVHVPTMHMPGKGVTLFTTHIIREDAQALYGFVNLDEKRLNAMNGAVLARESREGRDDKGSAVLAFNVSEAIETVQFHPEADLAGIFNWIDRPEQQKAFVESYGDLTFDRMLKTIKNPERVARVHHEVIPGWMRRRFNSICAARGWDAMPYGPMEALSGADLSVLLGMVPDLPSSPAA